MNSEDAFIIKKAIMELERIAGSLRGLLDD